MKSQVNLHTIDWNFDKSPVRSGIHSIHPYPAKFIPEIPRTLIELFHPRDSSYVLDPFCGSGTTLVEAIDVGLDAWGIDVNPLACLLSKVKTTPLPSGLLSQEGREVISSARQALSDGEFTVPPIPRVDHWFKMHVQNVLAALVNEIEKRQPSIRDALRISLSSIIVQVSNQESDTRYAAVEKKITDEEIFTKFWRAVQNVSRGIEALSAGLFRQLGEATILTQDIMKVTPNQLPANVGLVITSPPYPNAYEYWLYHKYRMYWLGMDPIPVREHEIGARPHYFKSKPQDEHDFESQMEWVFHLLSKVMLPNSKACFLVGRSIIHGREIDNAAILIRSACSNGFEIEDFVERNIPSTRKAFNPSHGKINKEKILVFKLTT